MFDFFNLDIVYNYIDSVVYIMLNVVGIFFFVYMCCCGNIWYLIDVMFKDILFVDEIKKVIMCYEVKIYIFECFFVYYQMVKELR